MKNQKGGKRLKKINSGKTLLPVAACILVFGAISALFTGCGNSSATTTPDFGNLPTGTTTSTVAMAANASVSAVPSLTTVNPGSNFDVTIQVKTAIPTRGMQLELTWDPTKVSCNSVDEGTFYSGFAQQNNLMDELMPGSLSADNTIGKFPPGNDVQGTIQYNQGVFLAGGPKAADNTYPGPSGTGAVFILHMNVLPDASGNCVFTLSHVQLSDNSVNANSLNPTINNGQVTIAAN
jgi:hypothetical protein